MNKMLSNTKMNQQHKDITIGKDILELLSGAMYVDILTIYREFIQNASDSIDKAQQERLYDELKQPKISIQLDTSNRNIKIIDNGYGLSTDSFANAMRALGSSQKRGTLSRGFRGVGRLSGLGVCQELVFKSKAKHDKRTSIIKWDCRKLKKILNDVSWDGDLRQLIDEVTSFSSTDLGKKDDHFFEVELKKVIRIKNDFLLNEKAIKHYISQNCPVPFSPEFNFKDEIDQFLDNHDLNKTYEIFFNEDELPIYRPHKNQFKLNLELIDEYSDIAFFEFQGIDGDIDAIAWLLEHDYKGAIPKSQGIHGMRFRLGNIQVGYDNLVAEEIYPESRFNSWTVAEVHILNRKITPNGRRDHFEQNVHYMNLIGELSPVGKTIANLCRTKSALRNRQKEFELHRRKAEDLVEIIEQKAAPTRIIENSEESLQESLKRMDTLANSEILTQEQAGELEIKLIKIKKKVNIGNSEGEKNSKSILKKLPHTKRECYNEIFQIIFNVIKEKSKARELIDEIITNIKV
jgi:hypothetical protein